jgi:hypothetical protein
MRDEVKDGEASVDEKVFHPSALIPHPLIPGEDFYMEGRALVFTELYHLRRGYCCESGCRHCPFGDGRGASAESLEGMNDAGDDSGL